MLSSILLCPLVPVFKLRSQARLHPLIICLCSLHFVQCYSSAVTSQLNLNCHQNAWSLQMIATDNLDLGCTIFEKAATEKAIREIDERLIQQYTNRAKAKGSNQPFYDQSQLHGRFPMHLPDSLKPKPGHLNPAQQRVYEDFARIPRGAAGAHAAVGGGKPMASMDKVGTAFWHLEGTSVVGHA